MDAVLIAILAHGFCLSMLGLLLKIVPGLLSKRFLPIAGGYSLWCLTDAFAFLAGNGALVGTEASGLVLVLARGAGLVAFCAGALVFYLGGPATSPRHLLQKKSFAAAALLSVFAAGASLAVLLGPASLATLADPWRPFLPMPGLLSAVIIVGGPMVNPRNLLQRILVYVGTIALTAFLTAVALATIPGGVADFALSFHSFDPFLLFVFIVTAVVGLGAWHSLFLKLPVQFVFFRDVYRKEKELGAFLNELQAVTNSRESRESLLEMILQNLYRVFYFEKALILTTDDAGRKLYRQLGRPSARLEIEPMKRHFPFIRLRLTEKIAGRLDRVFLLEPGFAGPLSEPGADERFPRTGRLLRESVDRYRSEGYEIFLPLIFHNVIQGILLLGSKTNGLPYFNGEVTLLNRTRTLFAMALRNDALLREFQALGRDERNPLKNIRPPEGSQPALTRLRLHEKTLVYADSPLREVVEEATRIASLPLPVLIQGETGTGKELFARLLHVRGPGEDHPFVAVNCAAIPASLWESEIFGHKRGSFTGAASDHPGFIEQAAGGVLFFDEIGEMPLEVQPKILRLIQEKTYQAVGARKTSRAECRLVFATHRDLSKFIAEGKFREDLYYRINVHRIQLPTLRERRAEIPLLADYLVETGCRELGLTPREFSDAALEALRAYDWPGNIREMENCILGCLAHASGEIIELDDLPAEIRTARKDERGGRGRGKSTAAKQVLFPETTNQIDFESLLKDYARELIEYTLKACRGNRTHAAQMLGISRGKLIYQIKELGIESSEDK